MKTMKMLPVMALVFAVIITGCNKDDANDQEKYKPAARQFNVNLTDAPADFARIDITVDRVEAYHDSNGWILLSSDLRIINVVSLSNDYKTSLAAAFVVPTGHYSRLRIHFLDENTVTVHPNGFPIALTWAGSADQWIGIAIDHEVSSSSGVEVLLDFDAAASVYAESDSYVINPVMRELR